MECQKVSYCPLCPETVESYFPFPAKRCADPQQPDLYRSRNPPGKIKNKNKKKFKKFFFLLGKILYKAVLLAEKKIIQV
jgi:hypothetical protein